MLSAEFIQALIAFERDSIHYREFPSDLALGIRAQVGRIPILFSAPHATRHRRADQWKQEDEYTAAIAEGLHRLTGAYAFYTTHQINPDPHDDGAHNYYKRRLAAFIKEHPIRLVIDLHGLRGDRPFGVALGTMNGLTCAPYEKLLIEQFEKLGFLRQGNLSYLERLAVNHPRYTGGLKRPTITRFVYQELGLPAAQIEINAWLRVLQRLPESSNSRRGLALNFSADQKLFRCLMQALSAIVYEVAAQPDF